jgi:hypothetical protein
MNSSNNQISLRGNPRHGAKHFPTNIPGSKEPNLETELFMAYWLNLAFIFNRSTISYACEISVLEMISDKVPLSRSEAFKLLVTGWAFICRGRLV